MYKNFIAILLAGIALLLYVQSPVHVSAQTTIDKSIGYLDTPLSGTYLSGSQNVSGWFLDGSGVANIEVLVDGTVVGQAAYGNARPDVQNAFPEFNNGKAGFHYVLDTTQFPDGQHTVTIRETGNNGRVITLPGSTVTISNVKGYIDKPTSGAVLRGIQNISGWFLDWSEAAKIEVLVDGTVVGEAAYGDARPDVKKAYPKFNNGNSGFHYALDTTKFSDGQHTITIRETGKNGRVITLPENTVTISNVKGYADKLVSGAVLKGTEVVSGWFLDGSGAAKIEVLVDGTVAGLAVYGDPRPDVKKAFPKFNNGNSGFHFALDTTKFSDGKHTITIKETGKNGHVNTLPESTVTFSNVRGYVDKPVSGGSLRGTQTVSGWFLDRSEVASIEVLVDGKVAGQAVYGDPRADVKKAFPEFNNGEAGFHFALDTTQFSDGKHTIAIKETGKNGTVNTLPESTVTFSNVIGYLDKPASGSILRGTKVVSGWFLDGSGVEKIEILVDDTVVGQAVYGDARPDVKKAFPEFNNGNSGFHFALDTTQFSDGKHSITIKETGKNGNTVTMPASTIMIQNALGSLDNPASGAILRGTKNVSGWFLDGSGIAKVEVLVDDTVVGEAAYGGARPDVEKAFPEFNNGNSGFNYALDTTKFSEGRHTVAIRATGINGRVTTLPGHPVIFKQSVSIFLDPGHGGDDPGASAGGIKEADLNFAVAKKVQSLLSDSGYTVYMSRNNNTTVGLLERSQMANNLAADIFVSIHTNAAGLGETSANGIESYYYKYDPNYPSKINGDFHNNPQRIFRSQTLTNLIQENLIEYTGANNRGTDGETLSVVRESAMPATLIEIGFINNTSERQKLVTEYYQNIIAKAIADGISEYFRIY